MSNQTFYVKQREQAMGAITTNNLGVANGSFPNTLIGGSSGTVRYISPAEHERLEQKVDELFRDGCIAKGDLESLKEDLEAMTESRDRWRSKCVALEFDLQQARRGK